MPIYDYKCTNCGEITTEVRNSNNLKEDAKCEKCGSTARYKFSFGGTIKIKEHMKAVPSSSSYSISDKDIAKLDEAEDKRVIDYATAKLSGNKIHKKYY